MQMKGYGAFDLEAMRGSLKMSMNFPGLEDLGTLEGTNDIEAVYDFRDGFVMYMKWPQMTQMIDPNATWMKMDLAALAQEAGFDLDALMKVDQGNPLKAVDYLEGVEGMRQVGRERVRGVLTTRYSGAIDLDTLFEELSEAAAVSMKEAMEQTGMSEFPMDVWIDRDGLPRRMEYTFSFSAAPGAATAGSTTMRMDYFGYGSAVDIALPASSETVDVAKMISQQQ